jgi:hypothetical protein
MKIITIEKDKLEISLTSDPIFPGIQQYKSNIDIVNEYINNMSELSYITCDKDYSGTFINMFPSEVETCTVITNSGKTYVLLLEVGTSMEYISNFIKIVTVLGTVMFNVNSITSVTL